MPTSAEAALRILDVLEAASPIVGGGWGIDALVGRETRPHRDLDVTIDAASLDEALFSLKEAGFAIATDWTPVRIELIHGDGSIVDVHPATWDTEGNGVQLGLDGAEFHYPATEIVHGAIAGRPVRCISAALQRRFHSGYELTDRDRADLAALDG